MIFCLGSWGQIQTTPGKPKKSSRKIIEDKEIDTELPPATQAVEDSEDSDGVPTVEEMVRREDEEYAKWLEGELGIRN